MMIYKVNWYIDHTSEKEESSLRRRSSETREEREPAVLSTLDCVLLGQRKGGRDQKKFF